MRLADHGAALRRGLGRERARAAEALGRRSADLARALRGRGILARDRVDRLGPRLGPALARVAAGAAVGLEGSGAGLRRAATARAQAAAGRVERAEALLALLSPGRTVARGYAIVRAGDDGRVIASAAGVAPGDPLSIEMRDGLLGARAEA